MSALVILGQAALRTSLTERPRALKYLTVLLQLTNGGIIVLDGIAVHSNINIVHEKLTKLQNIITKSMYSSRVHVYAKQSI